MEIPASVGAAFKPATGQVKHVECPAALLTANRRSGGAGLDVEISLGFSSMGRSFS
jgi:hypothetical protein